MEGLRNTTEEPGQVPVPVLEDDIPVAMDDKEDAGPCQLGPEEPQAAEVPVAPLSLEDLLQIVRKEAYESRSLQVLQQQTHQLIHRCAILQKNIHKQFRLHHRMIEQFRLENRRGFEPLYKESTRLRETPTKPLASHVPKQNYPAGPGLFSSAHSQPESWLHRLSSEGLDSLKYLLHQIRANPEFLSRRITALSSTQLSALGRSQHLQATVSSVISPQRYKFGGALTDWGFDRRESASSPSTENPGLSHEDPLSLLLYTIFDESFEQNCTEYQRRADVWSTVCAHVSFDGKQGSEEFVSVILEELARSQRWSLIPQLELLLTKLVQDGASILDPLADQPTNFTQSELANARIATATSEFFNNAARSFLSLVTGGLPSSMMPDGLLDFIRSILHKIQDSEKQTKAKNSIIRWYTASFLSNALIYPEVSSHGYV